MENKSLMRAKVGIILSQPFFATLMMRKNFIPDPSIETACTNGKDIRYNPEFFDSLPHDVLQGVICHELMHSTLLHHVRREGRELKAWNKACDYALNPVLLDAKMKLPKDALVDDRFKGMSAESIYNVLSKEQGKDQQPSPDQGEDQGKDKGASKPNPNGKPQDGKGEQKKDKAGIGDVEDAPVKSEAELVQVESQAKQELAQAIQIAKRQGNLPAGIERIANEIIKPRVAWQEVLSRFLDDPAKNDYSWSKPNVRYLGSGFILPSLHNVELGEIVLIVDTSGSIDTKLLNVFAGEMQEVCSMTNSSIRVLYVNNRFQGEQMIEPDDTFKMNAKGGGGTDFRPAFEHMDKEGITPRAVVYFTDMACSSYPEEPSFPVLWAKYGSYRHKAPFGEVIQIDQ